MKKNYLLALVCSLSLLQAGAQCFNSCAYVGSSQNNNGTASSVTVNIPSGVLPNDVMIAAIHTGWCNSGSPVTPPLGWTLINQTSNTGSGCGSSNTTVSLATFYKVATATEPASYTFTGTTTQIYVGAIVAYTGVDVNNPINASSTFGAQDSCSAIRATGVTTTASCTRLVGVFFCSVNFSGNDIVPQSSMTERIDVGNTGNHIWGNENLEIADEALTVSGPTGGRVAGLINCNSDGWPTGGQLIALTCAVSNDVQNPVMADLFTVNPNPSSGIFAITMNANPTSLYSMEVYDSFGRIISQGQISQSQTMVDLSEAAAGLYFLKISSAEGTIIKKIMVE
jgi:Secretion system C-terminal sorting domain